MQAGDGRSGRCGAVQQVRCAVKIGVLENIADCSRFDSTKSHAQTTQHAIIISCLI